MLTIEQPQVAIEQSGLLSFPIQHENDFGGSASTPYHPEPANPQDRQFFLNLLHKELNSNLDWKVGFEGLAHTKHKTVADETELAFKRVAVQFRDAVKEKTEWPVSVLCTEPNRS